jgi:hypothetical protein
LVELERRSMRYPGEGRAAGLVEGIMVSQWWLRILFCPLQSEETSD